MSGNGPPHLLAWTGSEWEEVVTSTMAAEAAALEITDRWVWDVTGDGQPEVLVQFYADGAMRPFGGVLFAGNGDCSWRWIPTVDSCGSHQLYESLALDPPRGVFGSGFSGGCSVRESVSLRWIAAHEILLAEAMGGVPTCPDYENRLDLPLFVCTEGWPVSMVQEALLASGFDVDPDGFYGPGTQLAVLQYQASRGLPIDGLVDDQTWTSMHPPGGPYFPDFDGDGVSTPREIGSATGATEYGGDW
ncbi:peptidoglycan-binding domain-containing protein [Ilumatobacter fluminis]|uniref:peptidoglycan-binding domain-containing protein n=1 Tax=Ilumatobacter fluminis TaxID=467091 RepID=UPI00141527ED|nr:peptidoglycan-binding domain-containing protein [Ilumatobacter fluminis]